jgi:hypothetical protein
MTLYLTGEPAALLDFGPLEIGSATPTVATFFLTVTIPQCQTRDQELAYAEYACLACARQARALGGQVTSGIIQAQPNMLPGPQIALATYTYKPIAPS